MEINPTQAAAARTRVETMASGSPATEAKAGATDFQTFLALLTSQLRNQDPLKPIESTEFVAQLASFSGVEQQVRANDRLDAILETLGGGTSAGLAAWIGREVRAPVQVAYTGVPVEVEVAPADGSDAASLVVTDDFGRVVARRPLDPGATVATWDGRDALGEPLPYGQYQMTVESSRDGEILATAPAQVFGEVREVRIEEGVQVLVLEGGARVAVADVTAIR